MLRRETITRDVNQTMRFISKSIPDQPVISSYSFRVGEITQLWKDPKDIEYIKQSLCHPELDTTSAYVNQLLDQNKARL